MKGDIYRCPVCSKTLKEGDCEYSQAYCHRTVACRKTRGGWTPMEKVTPVSQQNGV